MVTNRQRNTVVKKEKTAALTIRCPTELSIKAARKKKYIGALKCLTHTHELHLNPFSFKAHEKSTVEHQILVVQSPQMPDWKRILYRELATA